MYPLLVRFNSFSPDRLFFFISYYITPRHAAISCSLTDIAHPTHDTVLLCFCCFTNIHVRTQKIANGHLLIILSSFYLQTFHFFLFRSYRTFRDVRTGLRNLFLCPLKKSFMYVCNCKYNTTVRHRQAQIDSLVLLAKTSPAPPLHLSRRRVPRVRQSSGCSHVMVAVISWPLGAYGATFVLFGPFRQLHRTGPFASAAHAKG